MNNASQPNSEAHPSAATDSSATAPARFDVFLPDRCTDKPAIECVARALQEALRCSPPDH
jgi:hypothetical protein